MLKENIENITISDRNFAPNFFSHHLLPNISFDGHCLIWNKIYYPKQVINLYISYTLTPLLRNLNTSFTSNNCLFGSVELTKNADPDKYKYSGCDIGFDSRSDFLFTDGSMGRNIVIFGADMSSSMHFDNKIKVILVLGKGATQGLDDLILTAETKYPIDFTQPNKRFLLSLHYNGINSFLFANATKIYQFKAKYSDVNDYTPCFSKSFFN